MRAFLKALAHAAIGGAAAGLATLPAGGPITTKTVIFPALMSALTSVISLFSQAPKN
jgi:hypothetical protein